MYVKYKIILLLLLATCIGCLSLFNEHKEANNLKIEPIIFSTISNGTYKGTYAGGINKWRANTVVVTVQSGRVIQIKLIHSAELKPNDPRYLELVKRIIDAQSFNVDVISGATLTTKAHIKAMEVALKGKNGKNGKNK